MMITISLPSTKSGRWLARHIVLHFENRMLELATAVMMLTISAWMVVWPTALSAGSLQSLTMVVPASLIIPLYGSFGWARIAALIANGHWKVYGPMIRALGALVGAFVWAQMGASLWYAGILNGHEPSIGVPVYGTLSLFELISMWRALAGAGHGREID